MIELHDTLLNTTKIEIPDSELFNFSFVIPKKLAGMSHPVGWNSRIEGTLKFLQTQGIGAIVSLTEFPLRQQDIILEQGFGYLHIPVIDFAAPTIDQAEEFVRYVDERLAMVPQLGVVVHCLAGCGRTGTMLACYLVTQSLTADQVITQVRQQRPCSMQSPEQLEFVHKFSLWWQFKHSKLQYAP